MPREASILVIIAIAIAVALGVYFTLMAGAQTPAQCFFPQEKDRVIELAHQAVDLAFQDKVRGLFDVWVRDPVEQPRRAMSGMAVNISAYHRARANIRAWEPEICK